MIFRHFSITLMIFHASPLISRRHCRFLTHVATMPMPRAFDIFAAPLFRCYATRLPRLIAAAIDFADGHADYFSPCRRADAVFALCARHRVITLMMFLPLIFHDACFYAVCRAMLPRATP